MPQKIDIMDLVHQFESEIWLGSTRLEDRVISTKSDHLISTLLPVEIRTQYDNKRIEIEINWYKSSITLATIEKTKKMGIISRNITEEQFEECLRFMLTNFDVIHLNLVPDPRINVKKTSIEDVSPEIKNQLLRFEQEVWLIEQPSLKDIVNRSPSPRLLYQGEYLFAVSVENDNAFISFKGTELILTTPMRRSRMVIHSKKCTDKEVLDLLEWAITHRAVIISEIGWLPNTD